MALAGGKGATLEAAPDHLPAHALWFGEDQARYVIAASPNKADAIHKAAALAEVPIRLLGRAGGEAIAMQGKAPLPLGTLRTVHEDWLPRFMAHG
jgi:phosphoribosylformylglycinamidine synthase